MLRAALVSIGLVVLVFAVFWQTRTFDFVNYDDAGHVSNAPGLRQGLTPDGVRWAFTTTLVGNYIPLTALSFLVDYEVHGLRPGGYHRTNVAFHAAAVVLLFLFLYRATDDVWPSALVAALFAIHPLRAESVAWVSSRKDVVCGLFWMFTLLAYATYARRPGAMRYALVFLGVCAALLAKPMAVTVPFVLLLMDVWPLRRVRAKGGFAGEYLGGHGGPPLRDHGAGRDDARRDGERRDDARRDDERRGAGFWWLVVEKLPLLLPAIAVSVATVSIQQGSGAVSTTEALPMSWRAANAITSYAAYLGKTVWPADLIPLYPFPEKGVPAAQVVIAAIVLAAITAGVLYVARRAPWAAVGWFWYLGTLVPVIGLVQVGAQSMADRYTYLPQIGVLIIFAWSLRALCTRWPGSTRVVAIAAALAVTASAAVAYRQTQHWRDSVALWSHAVAITPESVIARSSLGEAYIQRGDLESARRELETAIRLRPTDRTTRLNLTLVAIRQGRLDDALLYCRAMTIEWPEDPDANTAWGSALIRYGLYEAALERLDLALRTKPDHVEALSDRGAALMMLGRNQEALETLQRAVARSPEDPVILTNLAAAHFALGQADRARYFCTEALRRDPAYERALALQKTLAEAGR